MTSKLPALFVLPLNEQNGDIAMNSEQKMMTSDAVIDVLVKINCANYSERDREAFRLTLFGLVNLARAEQALQIQRDMNQATRAMYGY